MLCSDLLVYIQAYEYDLDTLLPLLFLLPFARKAFVVFVLYLLLFSYIFLFFLILVQILYDTGISTWNTQGGRLCDKLFMSFIRQILLLFVWLANLYLSYQKKDFLYLKILIPPVKLGVYLRLSYKKSNPATGSPDCSTVNAVERHLREEGCMF